MTLLQTLRERLVAFVSSELHYNYIYKYIYIYMYYRLLLYYTYDYREKNIKNITIKN